MDGVTSRLVKDRQFVARHALFNLPLIRTIGGIQLSRQLHCGWISKGNFQNNVQWYHQCYERNELYLWEIRQLLYVFMVDDDVVPALILTLVKLNCLGSFDFFFFVSMGLLALMKRQRTVAKSIEFPLPKEEGQGRICWVDRAVKTLGPIPSQLHLVADYPCHFLE